MNMLACSILGPELFALSTLIIGDDGVGRVQDRLRRTVVLLQPDDLRAAVLRLKAENILDRSAAEFIDALVVIANDANILISAGKQG